MLYEDIEENWGKVDNFVEQNCNMDCKKCPFFNNEIDICIQEEFRYDFEILLERLRGTTLLPKKGKENADTGESV